MNDAALNRTAELLAELDMLRGRPCADCARPICGHEAVFSVALGFKNAPHCLTCLAAVLRDTSRALRDHVAQHIRRRDCYLQAWLAAGEHEGFGPVMHPACLWPEGEDGAWPLAGTPVPAPVDARAADAEWDAGDMGCGELVLELRLRLRAMAPGSVLKLTAHDLGAPEDLPAWCGMTGHTLLEAQHPEYWIQRRKEN